MQGQRFGDCVIESPEVLRGKSNGPTRAGLRVCLDLDSLHDLDMLRLQPEIPAGCGLGMSKASAT